MRLRKWNHVGFDVRKVGLGSCNVCCAEMRNHLRIEKEKKNMVSVFNPAQFSTIFLQS